MTHPKNNTRPNACLLTCGGLVGLMILGCCGIIGVGGVLTMLRSRGQNLLSAAPDRFASEQVTHVFEDAGLQGVDVVVVPVEGGQGQIAIVSIDDSVQGADSAGADAAKFSQVISGLSRANQEQDLHIESVNVQYAVGSEGQSIGMTAPQGAIDAYASGQISQAEFLSQVDVDVSSIISYQDLMQLIQEAQK